MTNEYYRSRDGSLGMRLMNIKYVKKYWVMSIYKWYIIIVIIMVRILADKWLMTHWKINILDYRLLW